MVHARSLRFIDPQPAAAVPGQRVVGLVWRLHRSAAQPAMSNQDRKQNRKCGASAKKGGRAE